MALRDDTPGTEIGDLAAKSQDVVAPREEIQRARKADPLRRLTLSVLLFCVGIFGYSIFADRLSPYTPQATVQAYVLAVAPEVSGRVVEVAVRDNTRVVAGQLLFRIDPQSYDIAVEQAEARLALAEQGVNASVAAVTSAEAKVVEAVAHRNNIAEQVWRVLELVKSGTYAAARGDQANAQIKEAEASVQQAEAELERARQNLGPLGQENPQIRDAATALQQALLDQARTEVVAPADGLVTNLQLTVGQYASPGLPLMTFIDIRDIWINAEFRENSLGLISPGNQAEVVFDALPGRVFPAEVESISWGVARTGQTSVDGSLPTIRNQSGWVRDAQRFVVRLRSTAQEPPIGVRYNSQANVIIYADDNPVTSTIGWLWIRLVSILTYVI